jgi:hypothetical protein
MTYQIYSQQQLRLKSLDQLKQIYSEIGCPAKVMDKRCKDAWMNAISRYQASILEKVAPAAPDEQATAQAKLGHHITAQAQANASEELTPVEISFYDHEYYNGDKLVAAITHDDDHLTQRWVVMVNGTEIHRANTWAKCHNFITWHHKDGSLPVQEQNATETSCSTGNEIIAQIATECEKFELEILDDGIYHNDVKLGEVGFSNGKWWFVRSGENQERVPCDNELHMRSLWW